jgi:hypothetical protein
LQPNGIRLPLLAQADEIATGSRECHELFLFSVRSQEGLYRSGILDRRPRLPRRRCNDCKAFDHALRKVARLLPQGSNVSNCRVMFIAQPVLKFLCLFVRGHHASRSADVACRVKACDKRFKLVDPE